MAERALNSFDSAALRLLTHKLNEYIAYNREDLALGNAIVPGDTNATAANYCSSVGLIRGLQLAVNLCEMVEDELLGRAKPSQSVPAST